MQTFLMEGQKYFLTPVCLVPNGRAHLGHVAGPLLKMDALRRHLIRCGADVCMISLSDVHESHVPIRAHLTGSTPAEVANRFHAAIAVDFKSLGLLYDDFINPLDAAWSERYESVVRDFLDLIVESGNAVVRKESIPHLVHAEGVEPPLSSMRPRLGEPVVSGWLKGRCPFCSQPLVGFFCETCGGHFSPEEMQDTATAHFQGTLSFDERASLFLDLEDGSEAILGHLSKIMVRSDFVSLAKRYMNNNESSIRLTVPSPWGIEFKRPELQSNEVIWSYSALLLGCHLVAGERYRELTGAAVNPLDATSDVKCILSFGIDNAIPFLVGATGSALGQTKYKPFDGLLVNYFYDLDGAKFSTSRGHVIWAGDIVTLGGANIDLVRAYLCKCNPEFTRASFDVDDFLEFHNSFGIQLRAVLEDSLARATGASSLDEVVLSYLQADFASQSASFSTPAFDIANAYSLIPRWMKRAPALTATPDAAVTWLAGFALLAAPVMPEISAWVSRQLGLGETITVKEILSIGESIGKLSNHPCATDPLPLRETHLTRAEFNACLPAHLRR